MTQLAVSGGIFVTTRREGAPGFEWVEARDAADVRQCAGRRHVDLPTPHINSEEVKKNPVVSALLCCPSEARKQQYRE